MNTLNKQQLEAAARHLCMKRGVDSDRRIGHGAKPDPNTGYVPAVMLFSAAWEVVAEEIETWLQIQEAIIVGTQVI